MSATGESGHWRIAFDGERRHPLPMSVKKTRIMYIEDKTEGLNGPACIGRVTMSKSGQSLQYNGRTFKKLGGYGFKANYFDVETGNHFWFSGPRKDGRDRLYEGSAKPVEIDADVRDEYLKTIRGPLRKDMDEK